MRALTNEYWTKYLRQIFYELFVPWIAFSVLSLFYFALAFDQDFEPQKGDKHVILDTIGITVVVLAAYQLYAEFKQIKNDFVGYLGSMYNIIDLF